MSAGKFDPDDGARISAALVKTIAEAKVLADAGHIGPEIRDIVLHASELYDLLLEQLSAARSNAGEEIRGIADTMGNKLDQLDALIAIEVDRPPLH